MTQGCIYLSQGTKCIIRMLVSIHSLRKVYSGGITVMQYGEYPPFMKTVLDKMNVNIQYNADTSVHPLVRKASLWRESPYDITLFIDADTLIVKPIDVIWRKVEPIKFAVYNFAGWKSDGGMISARIRGFKGLLSDKELEDAVKYGSAVNTGIFAFTKDAPVLPYWEALTKRGHECNCSRIPDEIACQILLPKFPVKILPPEWGVSVKYSTEEQRKNAVIIHYHGMKHCVPDYPLCRLWEAEYMELVREFAIPELRMNHGDKRLGRFQKKALSCDKPLSQNKDITYVTAVNKAYLEKLKKNYPMWMKVKGVRKKPFIVFARPDIMNKLDFLNNRATVIPWDYGLKEGYSEREGMLTAFVKGVAEHVKTPYWCKIDADSTPKVKVFDWEKVIDDPWGYDIIGNRWGYTKSKGGYEKKHFLNILDEWWSSKDLGRNIFPDNLPYDKRYSHPRIASYVCLHKTEFSIYCNDIIGNARLPIPSHDTLLWYIATREVMKIGRIKMGRYFSA